MGLRKPVKLHPNSSAQQHGIPSVNLIYLTSLQQPPQIKLPNGCFHSDTFNPNVLVTCDISLDFMNPNQQTFLHIDFTIIMDSTKTTYMYIIYICILICVNHVVEVKKELDRMQHATQEAHFVVSVYVPIGRKETTCPSSLAGLIWLIHAFVSILTG